MSTPNDHCRVRTLPLLFLDALLLVVLSLLATARDGNPATETVFTVSVVVLALGMVLGLLGLPGGWRMGRTSIVPLLRVVTVTSLVGLLGVAALAVLPHGEREFDQGSRTTTAATEQLAAWLDWVEKRTEMLREDEVPHQYLQGTEEEARGSLEPDAIEYLERLNRDREHLRQDPPAVDASGFVDLTERLHRIEKDLELLAPGGLVDRVLILLENLPSLASARLSANRSAAIATLRNITVAQYQFQASAHLDADADGIGEYGGFRELAGAASDRLGSALSPAVLSAPFKALDDRGLVVRSGYYFRIYLPDDEALGVAEPETGFARSNGVHPDRSENLWCAYAWPVSNAKGNTDTFFVNQTGDMLVTRTEDYGGPRRVPAADAAFTTPGMGGEIAFGVEGQDGNLWRQVD